MSKIEEFSRLVLASAGAEVIKKLIFSRPAGGEVSKVTARLVAHRGKRMLALEYSLPGNTVSHKNVVEDQIVDAVSELLATYRQANLITTIGDAEWKKSSSGKEALLGKDKLLRKLDGEKESFEIAIESLDKKKNYILSGSEDFLIKLGISDKTGRVHDKRQGKFRQINRFLEYISGVYSHLPEEGEILIYDLCCGKSYLSFAVYYYLTERLKRKVRMLCIDLKRDVIEWCDSCARQLGYSGMRFITDDVRNTPKDSTPHMVISLHACDIATDIVLKHACDLGAGVILSTPCCHRYMKGRLRAGELEFVTRHPHLERKLCDTLTDALRVAELEMRGYSVTAPELTDPDDTPKNTLIRAIKRKNTDPDRQKRLDDEYRAIREFLFGDEADNYLKEIEK